jgi:hypothetical protein
LDGASLRLTSQEQIDDVGVAFDLQRDAVCGRDEIEMLALVPP